VTCAADAADRLWNLTNAFARNGANGRMFREIGRTRFTVLRSGLTRT
jgi:hypothetical protein